MLCLVFPISECDGSKIINAMIINNLADNVCQGRSWHFYCYSKNVMTGNIISLTYWKKVLIFFYPFLIFLVP